MAERLQASKEQRGAWARMLALGLFGVLAVAVEAAPLGSGATAWPSPDLLFCVVAVWALRAPEAVPVLLVFALGLMRDLLTDQPVGLGALVLVLGTEVLRARQPLLRRQPFAMVWATIAAVATAMAAAVWIGVAVSLAEPPGLWPLTLQVLATALVFPAAAALLSPAIGAPSRRSGVA